MIGHFHWIAATAFDRILYCLAEGTLLTLVIGILLRITAIGKNSRTRFNVWFAALLATAALPWLSLGLKAETVGEFARRPLVTLPMSAAEYVFAAWVVLASFGLIRVAAGLWQIRKLRKSGSAISPEILGTELANKVEDFRKLRPVEILVSERVNVPAALGFVKPAVLVPKWLADESPSEELRHVLLHEMEHLRRRDDWTNLAQKLVKAVLFFHPGVWWMERELSLGREMACDDAVLEQTADPRAYAQCLAKVAEKSFLRRQLALAQGAVNKLRQLSVRVVRILDSGNSASPRAWKPAVPAVVVVAIVSGIAMSWVPGAVRVQDGRGAASNPVAQASSPAVQNLSAEQRPVTAKNENRGAEARMIAARFQMLPSVRGKQNSASQIPATHQRVSRPAVHRTAIKPNRVPQDLITRNRKPVPSQAAEADDGLVLVVASETTVVRSPAGVQVRTYQVRMLVPASQLKKPDPRKT